MGRTHLVPDELKRETRAFLEAPREMVLDQRGFEGKTEVLISSGMWSH